MSAVLLPARAPRRIALPGVLRTSAGRLLRLELRRSPMLWILPLAVLVFWLDTYRSTMVLPPLWGSRALILRQGSAADDFAPFVIGAAAWAGGRDRRRGTDEQVGATALPRWAARLTTCTAALCWALLANLLCVAALYGVTAAQGAAGRPLWWPVAVTEVAVLAFGAAGFAAGTLLPSRFTAPLAAIVVALMLRQTLRSGGTFALLSPTVSPMYSLEVLRPDAGVFTPYLPDLSITRILFMGGAAVAALGLLGVQRTCGAIGLRRAAAAVVAVGLAASVTATVLVGTAKATATGVVVPALHDAADDRPIPAVLVCSPGAVPVCLNPVYRRYLPAATAALDPLRREVAGLPGAPVRLDQVAAPERFPQVAAARITGTPPVAQVSFDFGYDGAVWLGPGGQGRGCCSAVQLWSSAAYLHAQVLPLVAVPVVDGLVGHAGPAQQAVSEGLLQAVGVPSDELAVLVAVQAAPAGLSGPGTPVQAAGQRFAALPAATRHAWLTAHLADLRAGRITLDQLP
ncbi:hypothetical protein ABUW04_11770 [Streptacidiphilus sp. N1-10]|uniref:ABC transporter permease n=1 Tax=Streptacidiphilus jeojiensis TaxID=3229225 RepID=A0ABV6XL28_9ACTN